MSYKVIVDSCGELTAEMKASGRFETASLGLEVGDCHIIDDESFNQAEFLKNVAECRHVQSQVVRLRRRLWKDITVMRSMYMLLRCLLN